MDDKDLGLVRGFIIALAVLILMVDIYFVCFEYFSQNELTNTFFTKFTLRFQKVGLFKTMANAKLIILIALGFQAISTKGKLNLKLKAYRIAIWFALGFSIHFVVLFFKDIYPLYIAGSVIGFIILLISMTQMKLVLSSKFLADRFDKQNRRFPQTKKLMTNEYSVNFKTKDGWVNVVNPFRACAVLGTPGSGKSYAILEEAIRQHLMKGFAMTVYDFKYPALSKITYNYLNNFYDDYDVKPSFHVINFDDPEKSNRCNPLQPELLEDISDAVESAKVIMLALNREWIKKQGEFFTESAISFVACCIWALKNLDDGKYCTFPHLIQLTCMEYDILFPFFNRVFANDPAVQNIISPYVSAEEKGAAEQLEGQIATVRIALARLTSPLMYWTMTGNDFNLDINNKDEPKVVCIANNPQRQGIYGAALSLYYTRMLRLMNKQGQQKSAVILDEVPTIFMGTGTLDNLIATARSNKVATWLGFQDFSQLIRDYGKESAEVIINTVGNVFSGMVTGDTAKKLAEKFGKIKVQRNSISNSKGSTSVSVSEQMEEMIPASEISTLSQGQFVGVVADDFSQEIEEKRFYSGIIANKDDLGDEEIPILTDFPCDSEGNSLKDKIIDQNFRKVCKELEEAIQIAMTA